MNLICLNECGRPKAANSDVVASGRVFDCLKISPSTELGSPIGQGVELLSTRSPNRSIDRLKLRILESSKLSNRSIILSILSVLVGAFVDVDP